jgi:hypothetical protein
VSDLSPAIQQIKAFLKDPAFARLFNSIAKTALFKYLSSGTQTVAVSNSPVKLTLFDTSVFDLDSAYSTSTSLFTAQVAGYYDLKAWCQFDNVSATAAAMQIIMRLCKNGVGTDSSGGCTFNNVASPPSNRWFVTVGGKTHLAIGDTISCYISASDGVNTGSLTASNATIMGNLISAG